MESRFSHFLHDDVGGVVYRVAELRNKVHKASGRWLYGLYLLFLIILSNFIYIFRHFILFLFINSTFDVQNDDVIVFCFIILLSKILIICNNLTQYNTFFS